MRFSVISSIMAQSRKRRKKRCRSMKFPWIAVRSQDKKIPKMSKLPSPQDMEIIYIYVIHIENTILRTRGTHLQSCSLQTAGTAHRRTASGWTWTTWWTPPGSASPSAFSSQGEEIHITALWCWESLKIRSLMFWKSQNSKSLRLTTTRLPFSRSTNFSSSDLARCADIVTFCDTVTSWHRDIVWWPHQVQSWHWNDLFFELSSNQPSQQRFQSKPWFEYS